MKVLFKENNVSFAYLGGSYAINRQTPMSDLDIFVSWPQYHNTSKKELLEFWRQLNFKASKATKIENLEVNILEDLPLHVQFQAISKGILIFEASKDERTDFIESLLREYYDHMIWYRNFLEQALQE
ncbi:MAG: nucleotidyltransferase domain-containing protein [Candidatus Hodarchaeales archaeon]